MTERKNLAQRSRALTRRAESRGLGKSVGLLVGLSIVGALSFLAYALNLVGTAGNDSTGDPVTGVASAPCPARVGFMAGSLSGNDTIAGLGGDDCIKAGKGKDSVRAGPGNDYVEGGSGDDKIYGEDGHDRIDGGDGSDVIDGGSGDDTMRDGPGRDKLYGGTGKDNILLIGGDGARDRVWAGPDNDTISLGPGAGPFDIDCGPGNDTVNLNGNPTAGSTLVDCETVNP